MRRRPATIRPLGAALCALVAAWGCDGPGPPAAAKAEPPLVTVARPLDREVVSYDHYTGRLEPVDSVEVRARVSGYLQKVDFTPGTEVSKGDLLFEIDPRPFQTERDLVKAQYARDEARVRKATADYQRNTALFNRGVLSREDLDKVIAERDEALASVAADTASIARAELDLEFSRVTAPIAGRVSRETITEGNLITAGPTGSPVLTTIVPQDPLYVYFNPSERDVIRFLRDAKQDKIDPASIKDAGIRVEMGLADSKDYGYAGVVDFADNRVDASTGTISVRAVFRNPDRALTPGFFARVRVPSRDTKRALLTVDRAIGTDQGRRFVWVVNAEDTVERRDVKLGPIDGILRVLLPPDDDPQAKFVGADDWIVINGIQRVREGIQVKVEREELPAPTTPAPDPAADAPQS